MPFFLKLLDVLPLTLNDILNLFPLPLDIVVVTNGGLQGSNVLVVLTNGHPHECETLTLLVMMNWRSHLIVVPGSTNSRDMGMTRGYEEREFWGLNLQSHICKGGALP